MIKRRFYKLEHGDADKHSDSSSSSSDSEVEAEETEADDDVVAEVRAKDEACSTSSGYVSEDGSAKEVDVDSSGLLKNDDDSGSGDDRTNINRSPSAKKDAEPFKMQSDIVAEKDSVPSDDAGCILKCKSVFRCKLCPRIVCLTEESLKAHLKSKRHARSEKLLSEGRLKHMLNSDGDTDGETHAERHARIMAPAQNSVISKRKNKGRQRQRERKRLKKNMGEDSDTGKAGQLTKNPAKRRRKSEN
ncbi:uncharacterized protein LOC132316223 isoform X2 [Cornus florida]|uniref:uncharacterized protein LOC132316223 isoform X2 n=1 Tax=Cornus florida TaxID=4283 RepID=UPI00289EA924|nr:uncharacterized protein LOC132316223 isoform X2 [Cornus florida]